MGMHLFNHRNLRRLSAVGMAFFLAIVSTSFVFCLGFGIIAFAGLKSVAYVGLLICIGVATALVTDLVLLPALLSFRSTKTVEEVR